MRRGHIISLMGAAVLLLACTEQPLTTESEQAIRDLHESALVAVGDGDLDGLMAVYADDVISLPPGQPALVGRTAVRAMWEASLAEYDMQVTVDIEEVHVTGEWAFERGTFEMQLSPKSGGPTVIDIGKYLDVLKQVDGQWQYWRVSWNSSQSAA
jgi:uncharacterized protein (TIGR02246 family)